ncbi:phosphoglycolate phosphatase [Sphingomonas endophytica]|uniref:Phosphoglycolate phosphatase n=1 Tax=Sphingomonas endophytica TaxID=869719 RepID=A0A7X0MLR8_9SPHN|nr:HAD hydrolase-like protein [Sphingomonas endophytica]MBB6503524.1 phosphoglycolate phosphatase [Sphingomonas endophytica]
MTDFPFRIVGFDLDGTLLDTSGDLAAALNHALASAGRPTLSVEQVKPMIGGGARHMLAQGMAATGGCTDAELDVLQRRLLDHYQANIAVLTRPFPHAIDALDQLAARGVTLAVVTNKLEALARQILADLGLTDRFAAIIGGDTMGLGNGKPSRLPIDAMVARCGGGRAAFIGDSIYDITAAHAAGLPAIACSFGFLMQPVEELGAELVIDSFAELIPALERLA